MLDKLSMLPGVGKFIGGVGKKIGELHELGGTAREVKKAVEPISSPVSKTKRNVLDMLPRKTIPAAALTLQDLNNQ
jgi:hypothetical protein